MSGTSIVDKVSYISEEVKDYACSYLKTMGECINSAFHAQIVIEHVAVKITEFKDIPL